MNKGGFALSVIRLVPSGHEIACEENDTILNALEKAGYALPNNCRAGACGECKIKICSGEFNQGLVMNMALSEKEREDGYALVCMAKPLSPVVEVEWGTDDAQPKLFPPRENIRYVLTDRIMRTPRIVELHFRPLDEAMRFWPGQYVIIGSPNEDVPKRPYSIANAPRNDGEITLEIAKVDGGAASTWAHERLKVGDRVQLSGPYGTFIGDPSVTTPILCLASGSGLAPILSLTDAALRRGFKYPVTLLFSARTEDDVYPSGLISFWKAKFRNFKFIRTLTGEEGKPPHGRIPTMLQEYFPDLSEYSVFIVGNPDFVEDCKIAVKNLGAKGSHIHTEAYFDQQPPITPDEARLLSA